MLISVQNSCHFFNVHASDNLRNSLILLLQSPDFSIQKHLVNNIKERHQSQIFTIVNICCYTRVHIPFIVLIVRRPRPEALTLIK